MGLNTRQEIKELAASAAMILERSKTHPRLERLDLELLSGEKTFDWLNAVTEEPWNPGRPATYRVRVDRQMDGSFFASASALRKVIRVVAKTPSEAFLKCVAGIKYAITTWKTNNDYYQATLADLRKEKGI